jgi:hypothetical protein
VAGRASLVYGVYFLRCCKKLVLRHCPVNRGQLYCAGLYSRPGYKDGRR